MKEACPNPTVSGTIVDMKTGTPLDTQRIDTAGLTFNAAHDVYAQEHEAQIDQNQKYLQSVTGGVTTRTLIVVALLILLIVGGVYWYAKEYKHTSVATGILLLLCGFGFMFPNGTEAATIAFDDYKCTSYTNEYTGTTVTGCFAMTSYVVTINHTKSSFVSGGGENLIGSLDTSSQFMACTNICDCVLRRDMRVDLSIRNVANTAVYTRDSWQFIQHTQLVKRTLWDYIAGIGAQKVFAAAPPTVTSLSNLTVMPNVSSLPQGSYTARYQLTGSASGPYSSVTTGTLFIPFTITAPSASVNVYFSSSI
jgi:hypothetical protein